MPSSDAKSSTNTATTTTMTPTSNAITRTALDALLSKWSAISVGYKPIPENMALYETLLERMITTSDGTTTTKQPPRQSPLVSAGYALRIASVTNAIHSFVDFYRQRQRSNNKDAGTATVNIVCLGCGMDVVGLWASSLGDDDDDDDDVCITIWEVDVPEMATAKRDKLVQAGLVVEDDDPKDDDIPSGLFTLKGRIASDNHNKTGVEDNQNNQNINYHLIGADLRDLSSLQQTLGQAFQASQNTSDCPTLVVLELVLAYLEPDKADQLLQWCASTLLTTAGSALVAFEALGETTQQQQGKATLSFHHDVTVPSSIVKAYQKGYKRQFQAKLDKGRSSNKQQQTSTSSSFHPLGSSCGQVEQRFHNCLALSGFARVHACTAKTAAQWATWQHPTTVQLTVPRGELFDEHAALALHLASYVLVIAMTGTSASNTHEQFRLQQRFCPWYYQPWTQPVPTISSGDGDNDKNANIYVTIVEKEDEATLRTLFATTYEELSQSHAAVKKMVKSALKQELAEESSPFSCQSTVRQWYQRRGGDFFVAVQYRRGEDPSSSWQRQVVGGIGVRQWKLPTSYSSSSSSSSQAAAETKETYEIHRLFVDKTCRGQGVGTALLRLVESHVSSKNTICQKSTRNHRIIATTLALLEEANRFYPRHGYTLSGEESIGSLILNTYSKDFSAFTSAS